jgi:hypothetical protein
MGLLIAKCHEQTLRAGGLFRRCKQDTPNLAPGAETRAHTLPRDYTPKVLTTHDLTLLVRLRAPKAEDLNPAPRTFKARQHLC